MYKTTVELTTGIGNVMDVRKTMNCKHIRKTAITHLKIPYHYVTAIDSVKVNSVVNIPRP
jgi:hypothetical protein